MKYLIVQDWPSTHGNHAGMLHMCKLLKKNYPSDYEVIINKSPFQIKTYNIFGIRKLCNLARHIYENFIYPNIVLNNCRDIYEKLKVGDEVFLLEYLFPETSQLKLANYLRTNYPFLKIYGLSHLTPDFAEKKYKDYRQMILDWSIPINKYLTLGSSLTNYFHNTGIDSKKISTGFHYVDKDFYHPEEKRQIKKEKLTIITIGAMARNFQLLAEIVNSTPNVNWIICKGKKNIEGLFNQTPNIKILGYLKEEELRYQMSCADVSLSVMNDTIGSNVITTSLSMGLAQIVSDVGSIRDYCTTENTIFCNNTCDSFTSAINTLIQNPRLVETLKANAKIRAQNFYIENIHKWFSSI